MRLVLLLFCFPLFFGFWIRKVPSATRIAKTGKSARSHRSLELSPKRILENHLGVLTPNEESFANQTGLVRLLSLFLLSLRQCLEAPCLFLLLFQLFDPLSWSNRSLSKEIAFSKHFPAPQGSGGFAPCARRGSECLPTPARGSSSHGACLPGKIS